jgi:hypothetical protein
MGGVDDAEPIPFRIGEHDEVRVRWIRIPRNTGGAESDEALDLCGLFRAVVDDEVEVHSRMLLRRRHRTLQRYSRSLSRGWNEDREAVVRVGESNRFIPEDVRPEGNGAIDVVRA